MTTPFLSLTLLELALEVNIAAGKANAWTNKEEEKERNDAMVKQAFLAMLVAFEKEAGSWDQPYQEALLAKWDDVTRTPTNPFTRAYASQDSVFSEKAGTKRTVEEQAEMVFVDHGVRSWATPRGIAPEIGRQKETIEQVHKALNRFPSQHDLADRLMDWPGSGPALVAMSTPVKSWMNAYGSRPNTPAGRTGWSGLVREQSATALKMLVRHGAKFKHRNDEGLPYLAYVTKSDVVALFLEWHEDLLRPSQPFDQRKKDTQALLEGWKPSITEHLRRTPGNGRQAFSGVTYLEERLKQWSKAERDAVLLPLLSDYLLKETLQTPRAEDSLVDWAYRLAGSPAVEQLATQTIREGEITWTFEQWCCVRFLRGNTDKPASSNGHPRVNRLAKAFSSQNTAERGTLTSDLYALVAWCDPDQPKDQDPSEWIPIDRLAPLLRAIMANDHDLPQENRNRLHWLMLTLMDSPAVQDNPAIAPLLVDYTQWAWQEPQRSSDLASKGILEWLTQPQHADLLTPAQRHFVAVNHMTSSIPFTPALAQAAWELVAQAVAQGGHEQDALTAALPSPVLASGQLRASGDYQKLVRAAALEDRLPTPAPRAKKPRF